ncbi:proline-rich receptor-like protein kinase PERK2 [Phragmites australis]|uniref:proline-rich receptor-like protein kinase PERK2 n=1 Tax=Phragmites australis TaxID=29695 RepID=UPI002D77E9BE|nr:proline-rich receptor-like protein kinase PERK2 [Phragmites australis]
MALLLLHALLLANATAAIAADNATGDGGNSTTSPVLCDGAECEPPAQPLPIYGYPPPAPSLPSAPPAPPSAPGSQTPCPPVAVVCCGGAGATGGQYMPQQPNYAPPTGYLPYYNPSASAHVLLSPVTAGYYVTVACLVFLWVVV